MDLESILLLKDFKKFYKLSFNSNFNNENIIMLFKEPKFEYFSISQIFNLLNAKNKKLLKCLSYYVFVKFINLNITLSDELRLTTIEIVLKLGKF